MKKKKLSIILFFFLIAKIFISFDNFAFSENKISKNFNNSEEKLVFSISPRVHPFEFYDQNKEISGFDFDFAKLVAEKLNKKLIIKDTPILTSFKLLEIGEFDAIISTIVLSEFRKKRQDFLLSDSYFEDDMIFLFRKEDFLKFDSIKSLKNSQISCTYGCFMFDDWFAKNLPDSKLFFFENLPLETHALFDKKIDAILINRHEGFFLKEKYPEEIDHFDKFVLKVNYTILIKKDNKKLLDEINWAIKEIHKSEKFEKLRIKWNLEK